MRSISVPVATAALCGTAGAAAGQVIEEWVHRYDGPSGGRDEGPTIAVGADGNVYVTGTSQETSSRSSIRR